MSDSDLIDLYSGRILDLAANLPLPNRLEAPDATARARSPLCGSVVTVDLRLDAKGGITAFGQDVKACALGQAAASVIGPQVVGLTRADIQAARDQLSRMLKEDGPAPSAPFDELGVLIPARSFANRHSSILLTFDAILEAFDSQAT